MAHPLHLRFAPAVLLAVTATLGGSAWISPTEACAAPNDEWDIGAYDQCVGSFDGIPSQSDADYKRWTDHMKMCCERTGGIFRYAGAGGCVAPPAEPAAGGPVVPPGVATHTLEPAPPPAVWNPGVIATFTPAPIG
ncbi:hypothetical protein [Mycolicibacterium austroafricanum]|uniref:hypothetical protein n=1 Tax=Mycolicibacterium austroafricanum TaxID=39687 RepID=UPI001CA30C27|nr:hypothetical protein [Mycolicibacterium austroafricanum]QZT64372.1 hypothetical protein JN085_08600 [Mycolicibacterium austroafricanum]